MDDAKDPLTQTPPIQQQGAPVIPPQPPVTPQPPVNSPPPVQMPIEKPKSKWKKILLVIGILLLVIIGLFGFLFYQGTKDLPQVDQGLTTFLQDVSSNDLDAAYAITSQRFQASTPKPDFIKAMSLFKAEFADFQSQKMTSFNIKANTGEPLTLTYTGQISYSDGEKGALTAVMIKEGDVWKILNIKVNVGLKRMEKYQQSGTKSVLGVSTER